MPAATSAEAQSDLEALMKKMMEATKNRSYEAFVSDCDEKVKSGLTKQMFEGVSGMLAPRLKQGWKDVYLGKLRQQGSITHLWRLEFVHGKDDHLLRMSLKDGKVARRRCPRTHLPPQRPKACSRSTPRRTAGRSRQLPTSPKQTKTKTRAA